MKPGIKGSLQNILRWFAETVAASHKPIEDFSRLEHPASHFAAAEDAAALSGPLIAETAVVQPTTTAPCTDPVVTDANINQDVQVNRIAITLDSREIQRRRDLVRTLFNDFWSVFDDKPASFVERLDQAETYLNERLNACGEFWRLDTETREMLGLPPQSNLRNKVNAKSRR